MKKIIIFCAIEKNITVLLLCFMIRLVSGNLATCRYDKTVNSNFIIL